MSSTTQSEPANALAWRRLAPGLFVLLWASGFVVASLFYLTLPMAALGEYLAFGETLALPALAGMALPEIGVALVNRG